jgi:hypothetical protein
MADFTKNIYEFEQYGTYTYKLDSVGNFIFNSSSADFSQVYIAFPLKMIVLNDAKVEGFYSSEFEEFVPASSATSADVESDAFNQQLATLREENETLKNQLDELVETSSKDISPADQMATKQVILELRKALGQGRVDGDFSDTFPFTPLRKVIS